MSERLRAYNGTKEGSFRDSLVDNVRDLVDLLPRLNVTADPVLDNTAQKMRDMLCAYDAQLLREDTNLRHTVAKSADEILSAMAGYTGDREAA
jgi:hypothetical protein